MAAVSTAQTTTTSSATALTPPSSAHGNGFTWDSPPQQLEVSAYAQRALPKSQAVQHGGPIAYSSPNIPSDQFVDGKGGVVAELPGAARKADDIITAPYGHENIIQGRSRDAINGPAESALDLHETGRNGIANDSNKRAAVETHGSELEDVSSKWIHRDKLARIENEELQAAGIILPKSRARSKPRRDVSLDTSANYRRGVLEDDAPTESRSQNNSTGLSDRKITDTPLATWDLRLPDEIADESYFASPYGGQGSSRIPVAKLSPVPIALEHMERDTPIARRRDGSPAAEDSIAYSKVRPRRASTQPNDGSTGPVPASPPRNIIRSASDISPKKPSSIAHAGTATSASGLRKSSVPTKILSAAGRPKTRNGASKDSNSSGTGATRPSTRSGDRELSRDSSAGAASKQPEGDPPWMISAYRPDPRLPPDQQLLPTVARRLQQEKWEREGKFGNVYDREFRPLTDEGFLSPPEASQTAAAATEAAEQLPEKQDEWPLKPEARSSTMQQGRAGSYSTIPKIQDKPNMSPLPSPRGPLAHTTEPSTARPNSAPREEGEDVKQGCGCCAVM